MHIKRSLGKNESSSIRDTRVLDSLVLARRKVVSGSETKVGSIVVAVGASWGTSSISSVTYSPPVLGSYINGTSIVEKTIFSDE
jgi:hypothetical protein